MAASHCVRGRVNARRNRNGYPRPIWARTFVNTQSVCGLQAEVRKTASKTSTSDRQSAWANWSPNCCPRAVRLASDHGRATPTMNMNAGWMKSQSVAPAHSVCSTCKPIHFQGEPGSRSRVARPGRDRPRPSGA